MIFSKEKWKSSDGVANFVHASSGLSYETMEGPLFQAWAFFLEPVLGSTLCDQLTNIYGSENPSDLQKKALRFAQDALINLALWYCFDELNIRLTDQGHQRQESENFKSLYKHQEDTLKASYRNKGFNGLDRLISLFDANASNFPGWSEAPAKVAISTRVVRSTKEVDEVVFINGSAIVFLRLQPILKKLEQTFLPSLLGQRLYDEFMEHVGDDARTIGDTTIKELRIRVGRVIVNKAVAELIRQTGSLTDRGLYFEAVVAGREGNEVKNPLPMGEAIGHAAVFDRDAEAQKQALNNFVSAYIPDMFTGRPEDVFKRDNDGKRTVWL
jgi:hypothetical protein